MDTPEPNPTAPKAFVSYSWDDDAHKEWVRQLAIRLRAKGGVDVTLDRWHNEPGDQIPAFMERAVRENDFVIAVCTPRFKERSDGRAGGVGYEGDIMTAYALTGGDQKKFIPVLRRGSWSEAAPTWLFGRVRIDLSKDPYSELEYEELLRTLHGAREKAPPIGHRPNFEDKERPKPSPAPAPVTPLVGSSTPQHQSSVTSSVEVVNVVLIDDNPRNLSQMVEALKRAPKVDYDHDVITAKFHALRPSYCDDRRTKIDLDASLREVKDLQPGVAIVDLCLEECNADDISGAQLSQRIKDVCSDCCVILVTGDLAEEAPKLLNSLELLRFRINRAQNDFWGELPKRLTEAVKYHASALALRRRSREAPNDPGRRGKDTPSRAVYISYAWDDQGDTRSSREEIVNRIERCLKDNGYDVRREKTNHRYTGLISAFMKEIGRGGCVVAVLSDKYLRSPFCMYELLEVYRNQEFHKRVCPVVLADAHVKEFKHRISYCEYWVSEFKLYNEQIRRIDPVFLAQQDLEEIHRYRDISQEVGKLLSFIANMNPLTPKMLEENDFAILRRHIDACLEGSDGFVTSTAAPITSPHPLRLFYSYSHKDEEIRKKLEEHLALLKRQGVIADWHNRMIGAGEDLKGECDKYIEEAQVILLLVSSSFLASDYCWDVETKRAVERHDLGEAKAIPIILRPCDWQGAPFGKLQALPRDGKAITSWSNRDEAFTDVALGIRRAVEAMTANPR